MVYRLAIRGKLKVLFSSQSQSQSLSQAQLPSQCDVEDEEASTLGHCSEEDPDISFTMNNDGKEETVLISQNDDVCRIVRSMVSNVVQVRFI